MPDEQERNCCDSKVLLQWISPLLLHLGLPQCLSGKESACNAGDVGSIPGSGRSPGGGHGSPLQYSCPENLVDRGTWWAIVYRVTKSWTWLKWLSIHTHTHTPPGHRTDTMVSSGVIQTYINYRVITVLQSLGLCTPSYTWKHFSLRYPNDSVSPPWESLFSFHILWPQHLRFKPLCIFFVLFLFFCFIFLAVMGLCCRTQAFSSYSESGLLFIAVFRLLIAVASFVAEQGCRMQTQ